MKFSFFLVVAGSVEVSDMLTYFIVHFSSEKIDWSWIKQSAASQTRFLTNRCVLKQSICPWQWLTVVCETKWSETKRNERERNEMKICSLRNENVGYLQFAKWESVVCEMTICSLGNDNLLSCCVYSDILNRKLPPPPQKKAVSPRNFRLRGMYDVFVATYKV